MRAQQRHNIQPIDNDKHKKSIVGRWIGANREFQIRAKLNGLTQEYKRSMA